MSRKDKIKSLSDRKRDGNERKIAGNQWVCLVIDSATSIFLIIMVLLRFQVEANPTAWNKSATLSQAHASIFRSIIFHIPNILDYPWFVSIFWNLFKDYRVVATKKFIFGSRWGRDSLEYLMLIRALPYFILKND